MDINECRSTLHQQPFRPFRFRLVDGRELLVPHPDFVAVSPRPVIVINSDESRTVLEPMLILSIEKPAPATAGGNPADAP